MASKITSIFRYLFQKEKVERDLDMELSYHVDRQMQENLRHGMKPAEARRAAVLSVGGVEPLKEECREARLGRAVETILQDIRYGARVLRKNPGFALTAIFTLALGIGANTAIFSLVYGVLLRPLPYHSGGQLIVLHQQAPRVQVDDVPFSVKEIEDYRNNSHTLQGVVEHHSMSFLLLGNDTAERVATAVVSANFFDVLGVKPLMGRTFVAHDDALDSDAVVVLSYKYWQTHQSGDPHIVGRVFQMNDRPHTVIGVLPPIPQYPSEADVYMPTSHCPTRASAGFIAGRTNRMMTAFGVLKPGVTLEQAQADLSVVAHQIETAHPEAYPRNEGYALKVAGLQDELTRNARRTFFVLLGGAGFVLLIACANVANLLLARLLKLERELAVRAALGASKARLLRQLLTESVMVSVAGGAIGLALAPATLRLLVKFAERFTTRAPEVRIDGPVLLFTALVSVGTGIVFGLAPAFSSGRWVSNTFHSGGRISSGRGAHRLRNILVVAQVAISFVLLIGAGLMARSFLKMQNANPGFQADHLLTLRYSPNYGRLDPTAQALLPLRILEHARATGGVESAALAQSFPFNPGSRPGTVAFEIEGRPASATELAPTVDITGVSPGYFATIRQPVVKGRDFSEHDDQKAPLVALINQAMARHRFANEDPIGKRVYFPGPKRSVTIIGIVADAKEYGIDRPVLDELYTNMLQRGYAQYLVVRTSIDPDTVGTMLRKSIHDLDSQIAVDRIATVERLQYESMASPRVTTILLGIFAGLALLISASGIAAVMALSVSQRIRELGIRMALGAQRGGIVTMVVRQGLTLAVVGTLVGVVGAVALTQVLSALLYATSTADVLTFIAVSTIFLTVSAVACFIPARQVTSIDPLAALRQE